MTKYDFQKYVLKEDYVMAHMVFSDCLEDGMTYGEWEEAVCKELKLDKFSSKEEYELNESIRNYIHIYIYENKNYGSIEDFYN